MKPFPELAQSFQMTLKALSMYTAQHPRASEAVAALHGQFSEWLQHQAQLQLVSSNGVLFVDGQPTEGQNVHIKALGKQLAERSISGVVILPGLTPDECLAFLKVLLLKPAKLEEEGGVGRAFEKLGLRHIQLTQTQYREVREGDGGGDGPAAPVPEPALEPALDPFQTLDLAEIVQTWMDQLKATTLDRGLDALLGGAASGSVPAMPWDPPFAGALPPADLTGLGAFAEGLGWGSSLPPTHQLDAFRQALMALDGPQQLAVFAGQESLPNLPPALRTAFLALAPDLLASATTRLLEQGVPWEALKGVLQVHLRDRPDRQTLLEVLAGHLQPSEGGLARIEGLARQLTWDGQSLDSQLAQIADRAGFWELSLDQRLTFLRNLLDQHRIETLVQFLDEICSRLGHEDPRNRETALSTVVPVTTWCADPAFPPEGVALLQDALKARLAWENLPHLQPPVAEALGHLLSDLVQRENLLAVVEVVKEVEGLLEVVQESPEARNQVLSRLRDQLAQASSFEQALRLLLTTPHEQLHLQVLPFIECLRAEGSHRLMTQLGLEQDRRARARIMEGIRCLGEEALPAIQAALEAEAWFVRRNALNLLAELGHAGLVPAITHSLDHPDHRVRQAAVRALWKLGGPDADEPLLARLGTADPDTQVEILFGLGQIQSPRGLPDLLALASEGARPEKVRTKAIEVVGLLGRPEGVGPLTELLRRRGRIFTTAEPQPIRLAAARALLALGTPQGLEALRTVVDAEPRGADRDALVQILPRISP